MKIIRKTTEQETPKKVSKNIIKNSQLLTEIQDLQLVKTTKLGNTINKILAKNKRKLMAELEIFDELRLNLCERLCKKDANGDAEKKDNNFVFSDENQKIFDKEYGSLLKEKVEIKFLKFSEGMLDQFPDLSVEQTDVLMKYVE